jgi:hypothetical protein
MRNCVLGQGFPCMALTTMSFGEPPAGRMVNSVASPFLSAVRMTETSPDCASAASSRCSSLEKANASGAWPVETLPAFLASSMLQRLIESELGPDGVGASDLVGLRVDLGEGA